MGVVVAGALYGCSRQSSGTAPLAASWRSRIPISHAEKAYLESLPALRVGVDPLWSPMAFVDAQGHIDGISADYLAFLQDTLHLRIEVVPTRSWADTVRLANAGKIDIVIAASAFDGLAPGFGLSKPYVRYPLVIVTRETAPFIAGLDDLEGAEVAVVGDVQTVRVRFAGLPRLRAVTVASAEDGLKAVAQGRAFGYIGNLGVVDRIVRERYAGILRVAAPADQIQALSFGVAPRFAPLLPLIDRVLASVPETEREYIQNTWLSTRLTFGVAPRTLWLILAPVGTLTILFLAILWFNLARLREEVRQRRRTERELVSETRFTTLLMNTVPIPVCVKDGQQRFVSVNPAYEQAVGLRAETLLGGTQRDPDTLSAVTRSVIDTGQPAQGELRYRGPDGQMHEAVYWARPCTIDDDRPAVLYAFVDVSELRRTERRELELKRRLVELTRALPSVVFQLDFIRERRPSFELLFANRRADELVGEARDGGATEVFDAFVQALDATSQQRLVRLFLRSSVSNVPVRTEFMLRRHDAEPAWFHVEAVPRARDDGGTEWSGYLHDVTQAKEAQTALMAAKHDAEEQARARELLIATVSHEIRLPMSGIVSILQLLDHDGLQPDDRELVDMAGNAGESLLLILNDILDFAKSEHGELSLEYASMSLEEIVRRAVGLVTPQLERKGLKIECAISPACAARHLGDARRLGQVLLNLLGNAAKFTEHGGVSLFVDVLDEANARQAISIRVVDTGIGIGADDQARLFAPFAQARATLGGGYGGTGLGLAICKRLIEQMGGTVALESKLGLGTTFAVTLSLPIDPGLPRPRPPAPGPRSVFAGADPRGPVRGPRILLAEDRLINREVLKRQLARLHVLDCDLVENGAQALSAWEKNEYAMVITDCAMPVLSGAELIARVRQREAGRAHRTVLVALTADATPQQRIACMRAGADELCVKPLSLGELRDLLARYRLDVDPQAIASATSQDELRPELLRTLTADLAALSALSPNSDHDEMGELAHAVAGTAAWFGLAQVAQAAVCLQSALEAYRPTDAPLLALRRAIERALLAVESSNTVRHPGAGGDR
jgi:PAS domain S-box-containing protein